MPEITAPGANPLRKFYRQPKVYLDLPSKGKYYGEDAIEMTETKELPVYAMTAKDELAMKTPDALLNGQSTVDVIQSCVPSIKNAWAMPSVDLDAILIAIRIATYGETMQITYTTPGTTNERDYNIDLRQLLNKITNTEFEDRITIGDMVVNLAPLTYKEFTANAMKTFEEQRIFRIVNDDDIPDEDKIEKFNKSFSKLTQLTVDMLALSIKSIEVEDTVVDNRLHIQDFIDNADKDFFADVLEHLETQRAKFQIEPLKVTTLEEEREQGAPDEFEIPITFDQSNFFA
jgi:hypothetical protein